MTGIKVKHIPYRGTPMVVQALRDKEIDYAIELVHAVNGAGGCRRPQAARGRRARTLAGRAECADDRRDRRARLRGVGWYGLVFPAGTPPAIVDKMHKALAEVLARPAVREQLSKVGAEVRLTLAAGIRRSCSTTRSPSGRRCATPPGLMAK